MITYRGGSLLSTVVGCARARDCRENDSAHAEPVVETGAVVLETARPVAAVRNVAAPRPIVDLSEILANRFVREWSAQSLNCDTLRGNMTLVGPRPWLEREAEMLAREFGEGCAVRPGVTGLWQVSGRSTVGTLDVLRLDVYYVRHQTLRGDVGVLARTVPAVLRGDGAR